MSWPYDISPAQSRACARAMARSTGSGGKRPSTASTNAECRTNVRIRSVVYAVEQLARRDHGQEELLLLPARKVVLKVHAPALVLD